MKRSPNDGSFEGMGMSIQSRIDDLEQANANLKRQNDILSALAIGAIIFIVSAVIYLTI